ncbi:MAG: cytochrome c oxidase accessory protein CcoG [Alphaproteobacteria bacterium]|nr:cytochrome c oxidase accessory protein CcoG [Alphaproteobacteria bacterium]
MSMFHGTRQWIYTRNVMGRFQHLHRATGFGLIMFLFVVPWINVGNHPAVLADVPARRFYLLGHVFTASDGFLMVLMALMAAFSLFLASALLGRVWCGYMCPQTVFLEEWVRRVEAIVEGDGASRLRRDAGPWNFDKIWRKSAKVALLAIHAFVLAMSVVSWFAGARWLWTGEASTASYMIVGVIFAGMMADWLWFREQLCIYLCPYARFQSVLTDDYSLTVSYDSAVPIMQGKAAIEAKACIDCKKCVTVCPQGIDIRDGFQLECINCARCVDACTDVMRKFDRPSLVNYTTIALQEGRPQKTLRPRVMLYGTLVTGLAVGIVATMALHNPLDISIQRLPGSTYALDGDGLVRNTYLVRIVNNAQGDDRKFTLDIEGIPGAEVEMNELVLKPEEARQVPLVIRAPNGARSIVPVKITVKGGQRDYEVNTTFMAPGGNG